MSEGYPWAQYLLGLVSGAIVAYVAACIATWLQRRASRRHELEGTLFEIYMGLMELNSLYYAISLPPPSDGDHPPDVYKRADKVAWEIADALRRIDEIEELEPVARYLFSTEFASPAERFEAGNDLLNHLGCRINPNYSRVVSKIGRENMRRSPDDPGNRGSMPPVLLSP